MTSDVHYDEDDNKDLEKIGGQYRPLLNIQDIDDIIMEQDAEKPEEAVANIINLK